MTGLQCRICRRKLHDGTRVSNEAYRTTFVTISGRKMAITLCDKHRDPTPKALRKMWAEIRSNQVKRPSTTEAMTRSYLRFIGDPPIGVLATQPWRTLLVKENRDGSR
jgi:hypothetical protein